jgi:hypothetical protein
MAVTRHHDDDRAHTGPVCGPTGAPDSACCSCSLRCHAAALSGCASFSPDGGFAPVEQTARERLGKDLRWARSDADQDAIDQRVAELLAKPLSADDAVQVALLNNRGLQASFQELGITRGRARAGRPPAEPRVQLQPPAARRRARDRARVCTSAWPADLRCR